MSKRILSTYNKGKENKIIDKALELQIERKKAEKTVVKKKKFEFEETRDAFIYEAILFVTENYKELYINKSGCFTVSIRGRRG